MPETLNINFQVLNIVFFIHIKRSNFVPKFIKSNKFDTYFVASWTLVCWILLSNFTSWRIQRSLELSRASWRVRSTFKNVFEMSLLEYFDFDNYRWFAATWDQLAVSIYFCIIFKCLLPFYYFYYYIIIYFFLLLNVIVNQIL
jgi:hypothetical protein